MLPSAGSVNSDPWTSRRVILTTLGTLLVGLGFWLLFRFLGVAFILFSAIVLGTAIRPAVDWLHRHKVPQAAGVVFVHLALLAVLLGVAILLAPLLVEQTRSIAAQIPASYQRFHASLVSSPSVLVQRLAQQLPASAALNLRGDTAGGLPLGIVGSALGYAGMVWSTLFVGAALLALATTWTLDADRLVRSGMLHLAPQYRERWQQMISEMEYKIGAYVRGVSILSLSIGAMATVAYLIIGLPSALVLGLVAAVFEAVPMIGPILGAVLPALLALSIAPSKFIWVVAATLIIHQVEGNLLVPRVMDKAVGVSPIVTIMAILALSTLFGLPGGLLAIPLAALIQILLANSLKQHESAQLEQTVGRDQVSVLRYQVQELIQDVRSQMRYKQPENSEDGNDAIEDLVEVAALGLEGILSQAVESQGAN
jgi:predicted PurR-regulated permease PerM